MARTLQNVPPVQKILLSFLLLIFTGTMFLLLPVSTVKGISFIDALFTATSAVCVTGLIVLDTATDFTITGQVVILLLIQIGALGIMTFSIGILSIIGGSLSITWRFAFDRVYGGQDTIPMRSLLKRIVIYTFIIELIIALILFSRFSARFAAGMAAWHALFHAVSAFCNAGFSTFSSNLVDYHGDYIAVLAVSVAIILGGLGFLVLAELNWAIRKGPGGFWSRLSIHTRFVLIITAILIVSGGGLFLVLEWSGSLAGMPVPLKFLTSLFQSVTCRTAGFNTVDIGSLRENTLFMMIGLMFIGGSPGSIAGGIKTTTIGVILLLIVNMFRGRRDLVIWERSLGRDVIEKSATLVILAFLFITLCTFILISVSGFHG
ncbi:MAG: hypothetical protein E4G96_03895, partial [Chrysiogenales bacterium]